MSSSDKESKVYVDEYIMRELGFDYPVAQLFAQGEELSRTPVQALALASEDLSYEMNDAALLRLDNGTYVIIQVTSCSCWPSVGGAEIYEGANARSLIESFTKYVDKGLGEELMSEYRSIA